MQSSQNRRSLRRLSALTSAVLWRRRGLDFPSTRALLLAPAGSRSITWPDTQVEQHSGVPLDTANRVRLRPLPEMTKRLAETKGATSVLLPGGVKLAFDGVNTGRGEGQLILYAAPRKQTGTNIYGTEVSVSATGAVLEISGNGTGNHTIPVGGFILSAHSGSRPQKARRLESLRPGDRVAVLNAQGGWVGGCARTQLLVVLPRGQTLRIDSVNTVRAAGQLVLYQAGYDDGHTGTNQFGVEVSVRNGKVSACRDGVGDMAIPTEGYVLSVHGGDGNASAAALRVLIPGDTVRLVVEKGGRQRDLTTALAERRQTFPVGARCDRFYLAVTAGARSATGTSLGEWVVRYADDTRERIPVRYGRETLAENEDSLPARMDDPVWLIDQPALRCLVCEWANPRHKQFVRELSFEPAWALLDLGGDIVAATAAVSKLGP